MPLFARYSFTQGAPARRVLSRLRSRVRSHVSLAEDFQLRTAWHLFLCLPLRFPPPLGISLGVATVGVHPSVRGREGLSRGAPVFYPCCHGRRGRERIPGSNQVSFPRQRLPPPPQVLMLVAACVSSVLLMYKYFAIYARQQRFVNNVYCFAMVDKFCNAKPCPSNRWRSQDSRRGTKSRKRHTRAFVLARPQVASPPPRRRRHERGTHPGLR